MESSSSDDRSVGDRYFDENEAAAEEDGGLGVGSYAPSSRSMLVTSGRSEVRAQLRAV